VTTASISESISREDLHGLPNYKDTTAFLNSKDVFFTNLVLLGFDPLNYEEKYKIPFTRDMFDQNNRKGMEVVMHYLFTRLSPQRSKQAFKDCWPIFDKKQEQQFRKACAQWLAQIGKDDPSSRLPPIAASLLLTPGGTRFYQLMFYFSTYVVKVDLGRITGSEDVAASVALPKEIPKDKSTRVIMGRALQARIVLNQQKAVKLLEDWSKMNQDTREYVSKLVGEYRSIMKKRREIERELSSISEAKREEVIKRLNIEIPSGKNWEEMRRSIEEAFERDLAERSARVRQQWKQFEELYQKSEKQRAVMNSVLSGSEKEYELKGEELALKIPEVLLQNGDLKEKLGGENTYEDGKVNLLAFMRIWKLSLLELQKKLSESADVTKEGSVDASKHLDRLLEEQDKSRKKAEDLWLVFNAVLTSSSAPSRILSHSDTHPLWS
jgi:HAUS augmin-like complex subunit 6